MSANATEIESMLVRLMGDGSSYQEMLKKALDSTQKTAKFIVDSKEKIEGLREGLQRFGTAALSAFAAFGVKGFLTNAYNMFVNTESILLKLKTAVELNGQATGPAIEGYKKFADEMFNVSGTSKDTTYELLRSAESMGRSGKYAMQTARTAIQLATTLNSGNDPDQFIMVQQALEQGNAAMLGRMQMLRGIHDPYRKLAMVQDLVNKGQKTGQEFMKSTEGVMRTYTATVKALTKQFGQYVAEAVKPSVVYMTSLLKLFTNLEEPTKKLIVYTAMFGTAMLSIGPALSLITSMMGPVIGIFVNGWKMVISIIMGIIPFLTMVGSYLAAMGLPLIAAIGAIIAAVAVFAALVIDHLGGLDEAWVLLRDSIISAWNWISAAGVSSWEKIKEAFAVFLKWIDPAIQRIKRWFNVAWQLTKIAIVYTWAVAKQVISAFINWVSPIITKLGNIMSIVWTTVSNIVTTVWETIGNAIMGYIEWATPIFAAYIGVLSALWEVVSDVAVWVFEVINKQVQNFVIITEALFQNMADSVSAVFGLIVVDTKVNWETIKQYIVEALIVAEFSIRNMGMIWNYVVAEMSARFVTTSNIISHFFTGTLPAVFAWFSRNWKEIFLQAANVAETIFNNLILNLVKIFHNLPALVKGKMKFGDLWTDLTYGLKDILTEKLELPDRVLGDLEKQLRSEADKLGITLDDSFAAFREKRLKEINDFKFELPENIKSIIPQSKKVGEEAGSVLTKAFKDNDKLEGASFFSLEALARYKDFKHRYEGKVPGGQNTGVGKGSADAVAMMADAGRKNRETTPFAKDTIVTAEGGKPGDSVMVALLRRMAGGIDILTGKKPVIAKEAGF